MLSHIAEQMLSRQDARLERKEIKTSTHVQEPSSGGVIQQSPLNREVSSHALRGDPVPVSTTGSERRSRRRRSSEELEEDLQSRRSLRGG